MDHGSQYLSDHFLKQIRYWGIHPSFGCVEEPETNGVAERWNRTLKEQAIHGRIFQNLEAVRTATLPIGTSPPRFCSMLLSFILADARFFRIVEPTLDESVDLRGHFGFT